MEIRAETAADHEAVHGVVAAAFGQLAEADLVDAVRRDGDAVISLVARTNSAIVGHILLSRLRAPVRALGLAPVAVLPGHRGCGIGSRLVEASLAWAKVEGWEAVFVLGDPAFYCRFGFRSEPTAAIFPRRMPARISWPSNWLRARSPESAAQWSIRVRSRRCRNVA